MREYGRKAGLLPEQQKFPSLKYSIAGVSANLLHGFGRFMLQISQTGSFAAREAHGEATTPVDAALCGPASWRLPWTDAVV
jgi:hypothetical protein